jgi:hypothetical protein
VGTGEGDGSSAGIDGAVEAGAGSAGAEAGGSSWASAGGGGGTAAAAADSAAGALVASSSSSMGVMKSYEGKPRFIGLQHSTYLWKPSLLRPIERLSHQPILVIRRGARHADTTDSV